MNDEMFKPIALRALTEVLGKIEGFNQGFGESFTDFAEYDEAFGDFDDSYLSSNDKYDSSSIGEFIFA